MSDLTVSGLRVVREIALSGSFTAAARLLGYSQPAISRQVAAVEAAAGEALFVREPRGVRVTAAGAVVVEHAGRILASVDALRQDLASLGDRLAGRVKLGAFPAATAVLAPRALARLRAGHPGLEVILSEGGTPALLRQLRAGRLGLAVIGAGAGLPDYDLGGLEHQTVFAGGLRVAVPDGHRLAQADIVAPADLAGETWIVGDDSGGEPQFRAWPTLADPSIGYAVRGWPARFGLVAAGLGICLVPEIASLSAPHGVTTIAVEDPGWRGRSVVAVTPRDPAAETAAIVDALRAAGEDIRRDTQPGRGLYKQAYISRLVLSIRGSPTARRSPDRSVPAGRRAGRQAPAVAPSPDRERAPGRTRRLARAVGRAAPPPPASGRVAARPRRAHFPD